MVTCGTCSVVRDLSSRSFFSRDHICHPDVVLLLLVVVVAKAKDHLHESIAPYYLTSFALPAMQYRATFSLLSFVCVSSFAPQPLLVACRSHATTCQSMSSSTYAEVLSQKVSEALGKDVTLKESHGAGLSGGGGAFTSTAVNPDDGTKYFIKSATGKISMLQAEYLGVKEMAETHTIRVPMPICFGEHRGRAFAVFEYLDFCRGGSEYELGQQLAKMHRSISKQGFGFHVDNTIGATPQPNLPWMDNWADFWDQQRLGHMLKLTNNIGFDDKKFAALRVKTRELLSHDPEPSLVHGDLWGGNKGYCKDGGKTIPVIFDPVRTAMHG